MDPAELAGRIEALEDREAIRKLKARYAEACDDHYNLEKLDGVFTEDAWFDIGGAALHEGEQILRGKKAILDSFRDTATSWTFAVHYFILPDIEVDGDRASARWQLWQPVTIEGVGATWLSAIEEDEYVKRDGEWFIKSIKFIPFFHTPYDLGWDKQRSLED